MQYFPKQKISNTAKTLAWAKECGEAAIGLCSVENPRIRSSRKDKIINFNLANDILDDRDVRRIGNPFNIKGLSFPAKMQNYPISMPKIDLLTGEESKRKFEINVVALSRDAIEAKSKKKIEYVRERITQLIKQDGALNENKVSNELRKLIDYANYEIKDFREIAGNLILNHYKKELNFDKTFNDGMQELLLVAEESYCIDIEANEPILRKCNPLSLESYRTGNSPWLQDADIIKECDYLPIGKVIDRYNDYLKPGEIDQIESRNFSEGGDSILKIRPDSDFTTLPRDTFGPTGNAVFDFGGGDLYNPNGLDATNSFGTSFDMEGNILVTRVVWRSMRKVGFLTYFDEDGRPQKEVVDERFKANSNLGQVVSWRWINEWWEITKLGAGEDAIYIKARRRPVQFRKSGNPSICHSGYVGLAYNINTSKAISLLDRMKPLQYMYNVLMYRTELAFAKSHGKIMRLPLHEIPDKWSIDKYLAFAFGQNIAPYDAFKEIKKGPATGKLAGNMQQNNHVIDMEMSAYIQQHVDFMMYIKEEIGEISGVSKSRQGQIHQRQAVGNSRTEITQSSHITERWFMLHDLVKKMVYETFLDTAIVALKDNKHKAQIILGEFMEENIDLTMNGLTQCELGLATSNATDDMELLQMLKETSREAVAAKQIDFIELTHIYGSKSISEITRKLESSHQAKIAREQAQADDQNETIKAVSQAETEWEKEKHYSEQELKKYQIDYDNLIKEKALLANSDQESGLMERTVTLETLKQNHRKIEDAYNVNMKKITLDKEKLDETIRSNKSKEQIAKMKPKAITSK